MKLIYTFMSGSNKLHKENRLCAFGWKEFREANKETTDRIESREKYNAFIQQLGTRADNIAQGEQTDPFGGRANAPKVDVKAAQGYDAMGIEGITLAADNPDLPEQSRQILKEAKKMMYQFQGSPARGIKGLVFQWDGANLSVASGDPKVIAAAIDYIGLKKQQYLGDGKVKIERDIANESLGEFQRREANARKNAAERKRYSADLVTGRVNVFKTIEATLVAYKSDFEMHEKIREDIVNDDNPSGKLREYEQKKPQQIEKFKVERPLAYVQILRDAAKQDSTILEGREKEIVGNKDAPDAQQMYLFLQLIKESSVENPSAVRYYPERLKRHKKWAVIQNDREGYGIDGENIEGGLGTYREMVLAAVTDNPDLYFTLVLPEQAKYWTDGVDVPADQELGKSEQKGADMFAKVTKAAIEANPMIFFNVRGQQYWADYFRFTQPSQMHDFMKKLSVKARMGLLNSANVNPELLNQLDVYDGGKWQFMADLVEDAANDSDPIVLKDVLRSIVKGNLDFLTTLKAKNNTLYMTIRDEVLKFGDMDMRDLLNDPSIIDDEDAIGITLAEILKALKTGVGLQLQYDDPSQTAFELTPEATAKIMEQYRDFFENVSTREIIETPSIKRQLMDIIAVRGEIFELMPASWRTDHDLCLAAVNASASAYSGVHEKLRNDPDILLAALRAEKAGRGNMHWKDVPDQMKDYLQEEFGVEGKITDDRLLTQVIMGLEYEVALSAETVSSPFDAYQPADWQKDPVLLKQGVLEVLKKNFGTPEYILDLQGGLRQDVQFMRQLIAKDSAYFRYMDHTYFAGTPGDYVKAPNGLVYLAIKQDPRLIRYAHTAVSQNVDQIIEYTTALSSAGPERQRALLGRLVEHLTSEQLLAPDKFNSLLSAPMFDGDVAQLVVFLEGTLKKEIDGITLLQLIPSAALDSEKGRAFVAAYFKQHPDQLDQFAIIPQEMQRNKDFIEQRLFVQPALFRHIDVDYWLKGEGNTKHPNIYRKWAKEAYKGDKDVIKFFDDSLLGDVSFLVEIAGPTIAGLEAVVNEVPARVITDDFVAKLVDVLRSQYHLEIRLGTSRSHNTNVPEGVFDFIEHHVLNKPDNKIKSSVRFWPDDIRTKPSIVWGYLNDNGRAKMSDIQYLDESFLKDSLFVEKLLANPRYGIGVFQYINHKVLYENNETYYMKTLLPKVLKDRPDLMKYAHPDVQKSPAILWDMSDGEIGSGKGNINAFLASLRSVDPATRGKASWILEMVQFMKEKDPASVQAFMLQILPDPAYITSPDVIGEVLTANDGALIKSMLEKNPTFYRAIDKKYLTYDLTFDLIAILSAEGGSKNTLRDLLSAVNPEVRAKVIKDHPRLILDIFKGNAEGMVLYLGEEQLTIELMQFALAYYSGEDAINVLTWAAYKKSGVVEGILRARPDLYIQASERQKTIFNRSLGLDTIRKIEANFNAIKEVGIDIEKQTASHRLVREKARCDMLHKLFSTDELNQILVGNAFYAELPDGTYTLAYKTAGTLYKDAYDSYAELLTLQLNNQDTTQKINDVANKFHLIKTILENTVTPDDMVPPGATEPDARLFSVSEATPYGRLSPSRERVSVLRSSLSRMSSLPLAAFQGSTPSEQFEDKQNKTAVLLGAVKNHMEGLLATVDDASNPDAQLASAVEVIWMIDYYAYDLRGAYNVGSPAFTSKQLSLFRQKAQDLIDQRTPPPEILNYGEDLPKDLRTYYNLTNKERSFAQAIIRSGLPISQAEIAKEIVTARDVPYAEKLIATITGSSTAERQRIAQRYYAVMEGNNGAMTNPHLLGLYIGSLTMSINDAPMILRHIDVSQAINVIESGAPEVLAQVITRVNLRLPIDFNRRPAPDQKNLVSKLWAEEYAKLGIAPAAPGSPYDDPFPLPSA